MNVKKAEVFEKISLKARLWFVFGALILAAIITCPSPVGLFYFYVFPLGIGVFLSKAIGLQEQVELIFSFVFYPLYIYILLRTSNARRFQILFIIYLAFLIMNISGCRSALKQVSSSIT
jgi:hypothetical protein